MNVLTILTMSSKIKPFYERLCASTCEAYGITQAMFDVLMFVVNNPEHNTARDITTYRGITSGMVSISVEKLIQIGFLERNQKTDDRRIQFLTPTEKASGLVEMGKSIQKQFIEVLNQGISSSDREKANEIIRTITSNIDNAEIRSSGEKNSYA